MNNMKRIILFLLLILIYNSKVQADSNRLKTIYYYEFHIDGDGREFYGYSETHNTLPIMGNNLKSYADSVYSILHCCFDAFFGLKYLPSQILSHENLQKEQYRVSGLQDTNKASNYCRKIILSDSTQISVYCYKIRCRVYPYEEQSIGAHTGYINWYFRQKPLQWYIIYDIKKMRVCKRIYNDIIHL